MISKKMIFRQEQGLHLRPATELCKIAMEYPCMITLQSKHKTVNAKSVLNILAASIRCGDEMEIFCDGEKEEEALEKIISFLEERMK